MSTDHNPLDDLPKIKKNDMLARAVMSEFEYDVVTACRARGLSASEYRMSLASLLSRICSRTWKPRDREATP